VLVAVVEPQEDEDVLRRLPFLDDLLHRPVTPARLRLRLERALETIRSRKELHELNRIGVALSAERDIAKLLDLILRKSREITAADAGSLYLVERGKEDEIQRDDVLRFKLSQNDSVVVPFVELTMPLTVTSIAGYVALSGEKVNEPDAYDIPSAYPVQIDRSFDEKSGSRTKLRDHRDTVIGVVQLINKKKNARAVLRPVTAVEEMVIPFTSLDEELVGSLTSQAAVALQNTRLIQGIRDLFDAFVTASVTAIEKRDPTTKDHSQRVATLTVGLAEKVDAAGGGPFRDQRFTRDQIQEIRYASLLHDFGKVSVKEKFLLKEKKFFDRQLQLIQQRFAYIKRTREAEHLQAKLEQLASGRTTIDLLTDMDAAHEAQQREIDQLLRAVVQANEPKILEGDEARSLLLELRDRTYRDWDGSPRPFLTGEELESLSIRKGSLTEEERLEINKHVIHTYEFLRGIPWTSEYRGIPEIAWAHHEKLDGSGYPRGLRGVSQIPIQSRMMTISDIYDALTAFDRPYKDSVKRETALDILREEAKTGKVDADLLAIFIEARVYELTRPDTTSRAEVER
jgi:HD-GYP domain-containing protein (c-di-GMP phosphodiesterase class II)